MIVRRWAYRVFILISVLIITAQGLGSAPTQAQETAATRIESDDPQVTQGGTWASQTVNQASGGRYLYSSGAEADVLTLQFSGPSIEVMYVAGPSLGTLAIDVDGTVLRTVITTAEQVSYQQVSRVDYLTNETHTLQIYAQEGGIVAIDAFVIPPAPSSEATLTSSEDDGSAQSSTCAPLHVIHRVSLTEWREQANRISTAPSISGDGRYVAFVSEASLVADDGDNIHDIYVYDRQTCALQLVSVSSTQQKGNSTSEAPQISADGRYVTYQSIANNLVTGDTNRASDIFVYDRQTATTLRLTNAVDIYAFDPDISADGHYITFYTAASLVVEDTNGQTDVYVYDTPATGFPLSRVSVATGGVQATGGSSFSPTISGNGRFVAFTSLTTNLVPGDTNGNADVFVHDRQTGTTTRVSVASGGVQANNGSFSPVISANGRFVAFASLATNLVPGDTNGSGDVFVHDRQTGTTTRVSVATGGAQTSFGGSSTPTISGDGRFVAFISDATNLVAVDSNGVPDVFMHDRQTGVTTRLSVAADGTQANGGSSSPVLSDDGRTIVFESDATNLVAGDTNAQRDIFVAPVQLAINDNLALFSPSYNYVSLVNTLADNPPYPTFTLFSAYAPVTNGQWVMGDWDGDGLDTPGVYANGPFFFTNKAGESLPADWGGFWIGINGPVVAGRFSNASTNDCIGAVDSRLAGNVNFFALYFTCDMSGATATPALTFQWLSTPLPNPTFSGAFQFSAGDFNGDGLDSIAVRRNEFIAYGNVNPAAGNAIFDLAQYIGAPGQGDGGTLVVGDWDGSGADSFGLFYQNGELFYRNDLDFNSGAYVNQTIGAPLGNTGVQAATWR